MYTVPLGRLFKHEISDEMYIYIYFQPKLLLFVMNI